MKTPPTYEDLRQQLAHRDAEIAGRDAEIMMLREQVTEIEQLREQVALLKALYYARKSEKLRPAQANSYQFSLFDEAEFVTRSEPVVHEEAELSNIPAHTRKKRGRKPLNPDFPREDVLIDLPEEQKVCPCGCALTRIGEEISEKLDIIPQKVIVKRYIRPKYACKACEGTEDTGKTGKIVSMPKMLIAQGIVTSSLLAYILVAKFCDALPFYRQTGIFRRLGIDISRATMSSWALQAGRQCVPLIELFAQTLREGPIINMDETPVQVLREKDRPNTTKSYMLVACGGHPSRKIVLFCYAPTRSGTMATDIVGPRYCGYLQTDGYGGYTALGEREGITHVGCLVHVRRKFLEVGKGSKKGPSVATNILNCIKNIYHHEKMLIKNVQNDDEILAVRDKKIRPLLAQIHEFLLKTNAPPKSLLGKAVSYALGQWKRVEAYLTTRSSHQK